MSGRLIDLLLRLTARERLLLGSALLVILLGLGFGLLLPLQEHRLNAEARLAEAQALELWIAERIAEKQSLNQDNGPVAQDPIGPSGVEAGLISARLRPALTSLSTQADGALDLRFDRVDFTQLGQWLMTAHPAWGYRIDSFRLEALEGETQSGRVAAWISLSPADQ
jgi:type II secretory pathway component PulM